jgi:hypothetical protein
MTDLLRYNRLERLKADWLDNLVEVTAVAADTARIDVMRYNDRTGEQYVYQTVEVNVSDIDEAITDSQAKTTLLNQLKTVVQAALDDYTP